MADITALLLSPTDSSMLSDNKEFHVTREQISMIQTTGYQKIDQESLIHHEKIIPKFNLAYQMISTVEKCLRDL